jgi:hypothetical protein
VGLARSAEDIVARVSVLQHGLAQIDMGNLGASLEREGRINDLIVDMTISLMQLCDELEQPMVFPPGFNLAAALMRAPITRN